MKKRLYTAGGIFILTYGLLVTFYLATYFACRDCVAVTAQVNYVAHYVLLLAGLLLIVGLIFYLRKWVWLACLPGVLVFGLWYVPLFFPRSTSEAEGLEITAASFNVLRHHEDSDAILDIIENFDADIVGLYELNPEMSARLESELGAEYPYQFTQIGDGYEGIGLLSRHPITEPFLLVRDEDIEDIALDQQGYLRAVVEVEGQLIAVYLVHPPIADVFPVFKYDDQYLEREVNEAVAAVQEESLPVLLMCDCNSAPLTEQHAKFEEVLNDSFEEVGRGLGLTFKWMSFSPISLVRIDYIWYSDEFVALEAKVWDETGSADHHPIWGRFVLKQ
ncbi:MAG: endonuclease/exonuclease/phosphatase family protein [Anaerolineae bacterium]|nr:endonuclease/exonuclease/phosphatase family protein [Anaerolineae bacterium]